MIFSVNLATNLREFFALFVTIRAIRCNFLNDHMDSQRAIISYGIIQEVKWGYKRPFFPPLPNHLQQPLRRHFRIRLNLIWRPHARGAAIAATAVAHQFHRCTDDLPAQFKQRLT